MHESVDKTLRKTFMQIVCVRVLNCMRDKHTDRKREREKEERDKERERERGGGEGEGEWKRGSERE